MDTARGATAADARASQYANTSDWPEVGKTSRGSLCKGVAATHLSAADEPVTVLAATDSMTCSTMPQLVKREYRHVLRDDYGQTNNMRNPATAPPWTRRVDPDRTF